MTNQPQAAAGELLPLPCPFCGAEITQEKRAKVWMHPGVITDDDCMLSGTGLRPSQITLWNTRPIPTPSTEPVVEQDEIAPIERQDMTGKWPGVGGFVLLVGERQWIKLAQVVGGPSRAGIRTLKTANGGAFACENGRCSSFGPNGTPGNSGWFVAPVSAAFAQHRHHHSRPDAVPRKAAADAYQEWLKLPEEEREQERSYIHGFNAGWESAMEQGCPDAVPAGDVGELVERLRDTRRRTVPAVNLFQLSKDEAAKSATLLTTLAADNARLENKLRMIVSHATCGSCSDIDLSTNDISCRITAHVNRVWEAAQTAAREAIPVQPEGEATAFVDESKDVFPQIERRADNIDTILDTLPDILAHIKKVEAENAGLREALEEGLKLAEALNLAADEMNGELDRQTYDNRIRAGVYQDSDQFDVVLTAQQMGNFNDAIVAWQHSAARTALEASTTMSDRGGE